MRAWLAGKEEAGAFWEVDAGELIDHCSGGVCDSSADVASANPVDVIESVDDEEDWFIGVLGAAVAQSLGEGFSGSRESGADACDGVRSLKVRAG